jgi:hypothetical protein
MGNNVYTAMESRTAMPAAPPGYRPLSRMPAAGRNFTAGSDRDNGGP